jgi:sigma-B regulation protein RsbU (phosphoserine phosphatase)
VPPRPPRLAVIEPNGARREIEISPLPFRIGRQADNELPVRDSRISRRQAQITVESSGALVLEDLGSRHGTFINGQKILRQELHPQDNIDFGIPNSFRLIFMGKESKLDELIERAGVAEPDQTGSRELYHLGLMLDVARSLGSGLALEEVLATVVDAAIQVTGTERGLLLLTGEDGSLAPAVARNAQRGTLSPDQMQVSSSVLKRVTSTRRELIVRDTEDDPRIQQQASFAKLELHTVVAIPVDKLPTIQTGDATISTRRSELLGVLYLDSHQPSSAFSEMDRAVLSNLAREAATVIENARLFSDARAKARFDHELEIASQIQRQLSPTTFPQLPFVSVTASTLACFSVGGDCLNVVELDGGRLGFFIADVSGKGMSAALLATLLQGVLDTTIAMNLPLEEAAQRVNRYLCKRSSDERYATLFYGVLAVDGQFEFVNCGHVPPMIRRASGAVEDLTEGNMPVGMFAEAEFSCARARLEPGDFLVVYTDGVSEAANTQSELYGEERIREVLREYTGETVEDLAGCIQQSISLFINGAPQSDDVTLLVARYRGSASA